MGASDFTTKDSGERAQFESGMQRDTEVGKPRFDLMLPLNVPYEEQMITRLAALYGRGAVKYSQPSPVSYAQLVDFCSCENRAAILIDLTTLEECAGRAMSEIFGLATRSTPSDNEQTLERGVSIPTIEPARRREISRIAKAVEMTGPSDRNTAGGPHSDSLLTRARNFFVELMGSASYVSTSSELVAQTSITITERVSLEAFCVHVATRDWDSSETRWNLLRGHSPTCRLHRLRSSSNGFLLSNDRNWEQANSQAEMERMKSSAFRHFMQWLTGEVDEDHAAAVMFNIIAFETTKYKVDRAIDGLQQHEVEAVTQIVDDVRAGEGRPTVTPTDMSRDYDPASPSEPQPDGSDCEPVATFDSDEPIPVKCDTNLGYYRCPVSINNGCTLAGHGNEF